MSDFAKALIVLTLATMLAYLLLIGLGMRFLVLGPERLEPFDLRVLGYSFYEARAYLELLTPEQANLYTGTLRKIDTVFPILMGVWMGMVLWGATRDIHPWSRVILLTAPASYTMMDLAENALVADMVYAGADGVDWDLVALANAYTVSKFMTLFVAFALLLVMIVRKIKKSGWGA